MQGCGGTTNAILVSLSRDSRLAALDERTNASAATLLMEVVAGLQGAAIDSSFVGIDSGITACPTEL